MSLHLRLTVWEVGARAATGGKWEKVLLHVMRSPRVTVCLSFNCLSVASPCETLVSLLNCYVYLHVYMLHVSK